MGWVTAGSRGVERLGGDTAVALWAQRGGCDMWCRGWGRRSGMIGIVGRTAESSGVITEVPVGRGGAKSRRVSHVTLLEPAV